MYTSLPAGSTDSTCPSGTHHVEDGTELGTTACATAGSDPNNPTATANSKPIPRPPRRTRPANGNPDSTRALITQPYAPHAKAPTVSCHLPTPLPTLRKRPAHPPGPRPARQTAGRVRCCWWRRAGFRVRAVVWSMARLRTSASRGSLGMSAAFRIRWWRSKRQAVNRASRPRFRISAEERKPRQTATSCPNGRQLAASAGTQPAIAFAQEQAPGAPAGRLRSS